MGILDQLIRSEEAIDLLTNIPAVRRKYEGIGGIDDGGDLACWGATATDAHRRPSGTTPRP